MLARGSPPRCSGPTSKRYLARQNEHTATRARPPTAHLRARQPPEPRNGPAFDNPQYAFQVLLDLRERGPRVGFLRPSLVHQLCQAPVLCVVAASGEERRSMATSDQTMDFADLRPFPWPLIRVAQRLEDDARKRVHVHLQENNQSSSAMLPSETLARPHLFVVDSIRQQLWGHVVPRAGFVACVEIIWA